MWLLFEFYQQLTGISNPALHAHKGLSDITHQVEAIVAESGVQTGMVNLYVQGATAGIMTQFKIMAPLLRIREFLSGRVYH